MIETYAPRDGFLVNLKDGPRRFGAFYHFPGTGPAEETCGGCEHFLPASNKGRGRCMRWIIHRGLASRLDDKNEGDIDWWRGLPCIDASTSACKYWVSTSRNRSRRMKLHRGPEDEFDPAVNGDPDSLTGEEAEEGFDEMADWPEPDFEAEDDEEEGEDE